MIRHPAHFTAKFTAVRLTIAYQPSVAEYWASRKENDMEIHHKITPCLWFDHQAEEAARFYTALFPNSKIGSIARYGKEGYEIHHQPEGTVMTIEFEIAGQPFTALNGGPVFKFNEAISFQVQCETQAEVDYYWEKLSEGGDETAQQCGWLKDKYGVSWQVIPKGLGELIGDPDPERAQRATQAMLQMKKLDINAIRRAYDGPSQA
jgi:predicted 3-demethylubiquinone-9 3-methyltransferase (glyoxalase superfamily)